MKVTQTVNTKATATVSRKGKKIDPAVGKMSDEILGLIKDGSRTAETAVGVTFDSAKEAQRVETAIRNGFKSNSTLRVSVAKDTANASVRYFWTRPVEEDEAQATDKVAA